jgi:ribosomal protein S27AE
MSTLSPNQRKSILDALARSNASLRCPRCAQGQLGLADGYVVDHLQQEPRNVVIGGDNRLTSIVLICDRCGYMAQHALDVLTPSD